MKLEELKPNPRNPRTISDSRLEALKLSLAKFGDLSGIVFNRTTQQLVGGHQRVRIFREANGAKVVIAEKKDKADAQGTVAVGVVRGDFGEFAYREVEWSAETEAVANLAANKHGGEFDFEEVGRILRELENTDVFSLTGFSEEEMGVIMNMQGHVQKEAPDEFEKKDENIPIQHQCPKCAYRWSGKPS